MKPWRDLDTVLMPTRIARLPRDPRGYPIPVNVLNSKGVLDFRATDPAKMARVIELRCCALCGEPLGARMAFVGGPKSMASRYFTDAPMHRDCAIYALQVCPFLAAPSFGYRKSVPEGMGVNEAVSTERPEVFGLGICRGYTTGLMGGVHLVLRAAPFESISWWTAGEETTAPASANQEAIHEGS